MKPMQKNEFDNVKVGDMLFVSTRWQKEGDKAIYHRRALQVPQEWQSCD